ncbi:MAG TPA: hypothetical protein VGR72_13925 [Candidatus Acidoferrales bacterium]|nr:hypothetical protein [Candidatus Acidoferrales bacterium]
MNELITAVVMAVALAATFGIAYCFAWLSLRTLMVFMPARKVEPDAAPARGSARFGIFQKLALGQKH